MRRGTTSRTVLHWKNTIHEHVYAWIVGFTGFTGSFKNGSIFTRRAVADYKWHVSLEPGEDSWVGRVEDDTVLGQIRPLGGCLG